MTQNESGPPQDDTPHPADAGRSNLPAIAPVAAISKTNETSANVLAARAAKEIEVRALVAMNRPRNIDNFRLNLLKSCERSKFAEGALYDKPVGGKETVTGLSIRFAEECVRYFGNLDIATFVVSEDDDRRVLEVVATDLETNSRYAVTVVVEKTVERKFPKKDDEIIRVRTNTKGEQVSIIRATDDALLVKQNALAAKAQREVVLKHIPSDIKEEAWERIEATLADEVIKNPDGARKTVLDLFFRIGVMPEQIDEFLGHPLSQSTPAELGVLKRVYQGMKQEGVKWSEVMETKGKYAAEPEEKSGEGKGANDKLKKSLAKDPPKTDEPVAAPRTCKECGGVDGKHTGECKYYAD